MESFLAKLVYFNLKIVFRFKTKLDEFYRRCFEKFLNDILLTLHRPDWPMTELVLSVLARICVKNFRSEGNDSCITFRVACVEYLGIITSRLHMDRISNPNLSIKDERFIPIIREKILEESNDPNKSIENIEIIAVIILFFFTKLYILDFIGRKIKKIGICFMGLYYWKKRKR